MHDTHGLLEFMLLPKIYNFKAETSMFLKLLRLVVDAWYCGLLEFMLLQYHASTNYQLKTDVSKADSYCWCLGSIMVL